MDLSLLMVRGICFVSASLIGRKSDIECSAVCQCMWTTKEMGDFSSHCHFLSLTDFPQLLQSEWMPHFVLPQLVDDYSLSLSLRSPTEEK